jgi:hypothetical protein
MPTQANQQESARDARTGTGLRGGGGESGRSARTGHLRAEPLHAMQAYDECRCGRTAATTPKLWAWPNEMLLWRGPVRDVPA